MSAAPPRLPYQATLAKPPVLTGKTDNWNQSGSNLGVVGPDNITPLIVLVHWSLTGRGRFQVQLVVDGVLAVRGLKGKFSRSSPYFSLRSAT